LEASQHVDEVLSLKEAAERVGVTPGTLRRWAQAGVIPEVDGKGAWTRAAVAHARIVARLRQRGHTLHVDWAVDFTGRVKLKGFDDPHQLCRATLREES
jgi:transposase